MLYILALFLLVMYLLLAHRGREHFQDINSDCSSGNDLEVQGFNLGADHRLFSLLEN